MLKHIHTVLEQYTKRHFEHCFSTLWTARELVQLKYSFITSSGQEFSTVLVDAGLRNFLVISKSLYYKYAKVKFDLPN